MRAELKGRKMRAGVRDEKSGRKMVGERNDKRRGMKEKKSRVRTS